MPSSTCWPVAFSRQCRIVSGSSANQSRRSSCDQTPTLFTQPPRLVDELTSGLTVTTRAPTSGAARLRSSRVRPSAAWVVPLPCGVRPRSAGTARLSTVDTGGRRSRSAAAASRPAGALPAGNRAHGSAGSSPSRSASAASWPAVSSAEWFCGCPSMASP
jgi:hypothetical protein